MSERTDALARDNKEIHTIDYSSISTPYGKVQLLGTASGIQWLRDQLELGSQALRAVSDRAVEDYWKRHEMGG